MGEVCTSVLFIFIGLLQRRKSQDVIYLKTDVSLLYFTLLFICLLGAALKTRRCVFVLVREILEIGSMIFHWIL